MRNDVLRMEGITKIYGNGILANDSVDFSLREGEIHTKFFAAKKHCVKWRPWRIKAEKWPPHCSAFSWNGITVL